MQSLLIWNALNMNWFNNRYRLRKLLFHINYAQYIFNYL